MSAFGKMFGGSVGTVLGIGCGLILFSSLLVGGCALLVGSCVAVPAVQKAREAVQKAEAAQKVTEKREAAEKAAAEAKAKEKAAELELRTWTDPSGRFCREARFLSVEDGMVCLQKADGSKTRIPLDRLSEADRRWITDRASAVAAPIIAPVAH